MPVNADIPDGVGESRQRNDFRNDSHLPECPDTEQCVYDHNDQCWVEHSECICEELRACEERVRDDEARAAADRVEALPWLNDGRTVNRNAAILAARRNLSR